MKVLFVLRGLPGSGKSSFIKENNLEAWTIEPDNIRMLVGGLSLNTQDEMVISQDYDTWVWRLVDEILEFRLDKGILTFLDATSIPLKTLNKYKKLCEMYNVRLYVIDFTNVSLEECKKRNEWRYTLQPYKCVPEEVLDRMYGQLLAVKQEDLKKFNIITPADALNILSKGIIPEDVNAYDKVVVFGDIHGCATVLKSYLDTQDSNVKTLYVFSGDNFDRGIENKKVLNLLMDLSEKATCVFVQGNHCNHVKKFLRTGEISIPAFQKTIDEIADDYPQLRAFSRKLRQQYTFEYNDMIYIVTHGGITRKPDLFVPSSQLIGGVGKYPDMQEVDETFARKNATSNYISIHGHRNLTDAPCKNTDKTFCLEGKVEFGGHLRLVEITKEGVTSIELKNDVYDTALVDKHTFRKYKNDILNELESSKLINKKSLPLNRVSYNFTRDAFNKKQWNELTTTARGLFVDIDTEEVVARSYEKFFAIEERPETQMRNLKNKLTFPVQAYLKENGFLGIVSYDKKTDDLFIATKSTTEGEHTGYFKDILLKALGEMKESFKQKLKELEASAIFECIDITNDPHIISYDKSKVVLLDIVKNDFTNTFFTYDVLKEVAKDFKLECKQLFCNISSFEAFVDFIHSYEKQSLPFSEIEGFVFVDANNYRLKYKTPFYKFWKQVRMILNVYTLYGKEQKENNLSEEMKSVYTFMKSLDREILSSLSLIKFRDLYRKDKQWQV